MAIAKTQETMYFWFEKQLVGGKVLNNFECDGKPNIKIIYDIKRKRIKSIEYQNGGKLTKDLGHDYKEEN
jgi:hypothetical protein